MKLSTRERLIVILTAGAVGLLALDRVVLTPMLAARQRLEVEHERLTTETQKARLLRGRSQLAQRRLAQLRATGLLDDASASESRLLGLLRLWAQESGLALSSIRPDRAGGVHGLREVSFAATGAGTMRALALFLYQLEISDVPVRVRELQVVARTEGADDLTVQLRVSTLWDEPASGREIKP